MELEARCAALEAEAADARAAAADAGAALAAGRAEAAAAADALHASSQSEAAQAAELAQQRRGHGCRLLTNMLDRDGSSCSVRLLPPPPGAHSASMDAAGGSAAEQLPHAIVRMLWQSYLLASRTVQDTGVVTFRWRPL